MIRPLSLQNAKKLSSNNFERKALAYQITASSWSKTSKDFKGYISFWYGGKIPASIYYKYFKDIIKK